MRRHLGTILGAAQAEADDEMLKRAFVQTPDYHALLHSTDFNYVVGRRGTGKSALFLNLKESFAKDSGVILLAEHPTDYEMVELQSVLKSISSDYRILRPITRLLWSVHFLVEATKVASTHYRFVKSPYEDFLLDYLSKHSVSDKESGAAACLRRLKEIVAAGGTPEEIPRRIAAAFDVNHLADRLKDALAQTQQTIVALYDRLDEGWSPESPAVAVLGGLAKASADYRERHYPLYPLLFVRDNMFRALAHADDDFTRHIEGHTLRLQWDEDSLFALVVARLRVALKVEGVENDVKVWNRFAHRELQGREGFEKCLRHTLFRPRDIVVLLNAAYVNAQRDGRGEIIEKDVAKTAIDISQHRLDDLLKEYKGVLPGLKTFVAAFKGQSVKRPLADVTATLQGLADSSHQEHESDRELQLFTTGGDMFSALYSVGFIGLQEGTSSTFSFCHDGTMSALVEIPPNTNTLVHPCYWKALDGSIAEEDEQAAIQVNDDYSAPPVDQARDLRIQRLGRLPEELTGIPPGQTGSGRFEGWVLRTIRLLLSGQLTDIELKPNPSTALSQRDVVGTNATISSFWKQVYKDYETRQVIFECKNYDEITRDDFRQMLDYLHGQYGRLGFVVRRGTELLSTLEQDRVKAMFYEHQRLIVILPTDMLGLCIRKMRTTKKYDYTEFTLAKHLNYITRTVLSLTHGPKFKAKRTK